MNNLEREKKSFLKNIMAVAPKHCENCGHKYSEEDFQVVQKNPNATVIHLKCSQCGASYMLNIMNPVNGIVGASKTPFNLDIESPKELSQFLVLPPIIIDEAIEIYDLLSKHNFPKFRKYILGD